MLSSFALSIALFYAFSGFFQLTPKTNLIIFALIFAGLDYFVRWRMMSFFASRKWKKKVLLLGSTAGYDETQKYLAENQHIGYEAIQKNFGHEAKAGEIISFVKENDIELVVLSDDAKKSKEIIRAVYSLIQRSVASQSFPDFYEAVFQRAPVGELGNRWFVEEINIGRRTEDIGKNAADMVMALFFFVILSPFFIIITAIIKASSSGPIIYRQKRIGRHGREFTLYKFRTMRVDAEKSGPKWWSGDGDPRVTPFGKFLRNTHLAELPQLLNIIRGELSFVGPRPERPEFTSTLETEIPYYEMRHIIKPGLTGWAQINYRYGASIEDAYKKLEYDIYYLKNRSIVFDILIIIKTARMIFTKA